MRHLITIALLALAGTFSLVRAAERPAMDVRAIVQRVHKGVIMVQRTDVREEMADAGVGGGSGFVFEVDYDKGIAYGITNHHVAGHASSVYATFWNNAVYAGEMVATEPGIDVSLIKLHGIPDERNLPDSEKTITPVVLGDSDQVKIGEMGLAMGSPGSNEGIGTDRSDPYADFLLKQSATLNVVTGRETPLNFAIEIWAQNRSGPTVHQLLGWQYGTNFDYTFRMSTTINPGNSGGPLFNSRGEVIGINFYGGGYVLSQNSNSAIPINLAKDFVYQILNTGKFEKPWLGLDILFPRDLMTPSVGMPSALVQRYTEFIDKRPNRLEVYGVRRNSPAAAAGFKQGDIITDINGQKFKTPEDVRLWVFTQGIGTPLSFRVIRNGKLLEQPIKVNVSVKRTYDAEFSV